MLPAGPRRAGDESHRGPLGVRERRGAGMLCAGAADYEKGGFHFGLLGRGAGGGGRGLPSVRAAYAMRQSPRYGCYSCKR